MKLLLAEDEAAMRRALAELLRQEGYEVDALPDGVSALEAIQTGSYDLILLDVMMPGLSGFEVVRAAREQGIRTPILMLTAKGELDDKVTGLDAGADDYLTKPFQTRELLARLRALCRRNEKATDNTLRYGDLSLVVSTATISCTSTGQSVRLGEKELRLLEYLLSNRGQILSREQLALRIWGYDSEAEYNNVEVYMSFARKKLSFIGSRTEIKAVRGLGYELRVDHVS